MASPERIVAVSANISQRPDGRHLVALQSKDSFNADTAGLAKVERRQRLHEIGNSGSKHSLSGTNVKAAVEDGVFGIFGRSEHRGRSRSFCHTKGRNRVANTSSRRSVGNEASRALVSTLVVQFGGKVPRNFDIVGAKGRHGRQAERSNDNSGTFGISVVSDSLSVASGLALGQISSFGSRSNKSASKRGVALGEVSQRLDPDGFHDGVIDLQEARVGLERNNSVSEKVAHLRSRRKDIHIHAVIISRPSPPSNIRSRGSVGGDSQQGKIGLARLLGHMFEFCHGQNEGIFGVEVFSSSISRSISSSEFALEESRSIGISSGRQESSDIGSGSRDKERVGLRYDSLVKSREESISIVVIGGVSGDSMVLKVFGIGDGSSGSAHSIGRSIARV